MEEEMKELKLSSEEEVNDYKNNVSNGNFYCAIGLAQHYYDKKDYISSAFYAEIYFLGYKYGNDFYLDLARAHLGRRITEEDCINAGLDFSLLESVRKDALDALRSSYYEKEHSFPSNLLSCYEATKPLVINEEEEWAKDIEDFMDRFFVEYSQEV